MASMFAKKRLKRESHISLHSLIDNLHGTLYTFSPAKLENLKKDPSLNFLLRDFLINFADDALITDPQLKKCQ